MVQFGFRMVKLPCGIRLDTYGLENIPKDRPVLFVGNHRSYFDVILTYPQLPPITAFVAKSDFEKVPILPIWMKRLYCEFLVKDDIRQNLESIVRAIGTVKKGVSMFIFPEGKRNTGEGRACHHRIRKTDRDSRYVPGGAEGDRRKDPGGRSGDGCEKP